jgi:pyruvate kinase
MDGYARSKIICTIGPASKRPDILREMATEIGRASGRERVFTVV